MAFLALLIGVVLIVVTLRGTHGELLTALGTDVPGFAVWAAAIFAVAVIGFIPGLKPVSRGLLALVILVIVLTNYKQILSGFTATWQGVPKQAAGGGVAGSSGTNFGGLPNWLGSVGQEFNFDFSSLAGTDTSGGSAQVNG